MSSTDNPTYGLSPNADTETVISRAALATFVWFVRLNPGLKEDSDEIARAFEAYCHAI